MSSSPAARRRFLVVTTALVAPGALSLAALDLSSTPARAQGATAVPPVVVETEKPKPAQKRRPAPRTPQTAAAAPAPAPAAAAAQGLSVPANTSIVTGGAAFSRSLGTSDTAAIVNDIPGGAAWGAGGVSSLPAINGQGADRVQIAVNGMLLGPACPNEMNPPMSFVNPAMIASMRAYVGVAPVSAGGDYTAGKIVVEAAQPRFAATPDWTASALVSGFHRSINNSYGVDAAATLANADTAVTYAGGWVRAEDYRAGDGSKVKSTLYELQNHALTLAKQHFGNLFALQVGGQFIPYQGYVNQYMDMVDNRSRFVNGRYEGVFDWGKLEGRGFVHDIRHTMGFIAPDKTGNMPMDTRATDAGYALKASIAVSPRDLIRIGSELHHNRLDDWWDPVPGSMGMSPNVFLNINDGHRSRLGAFAEWERRLSPEWTTLLGLRNDVVWMDTGDVQGYNAMYAAEAAAFNARDRAKTDVNIGGSALVRYEPDAGSVFELGFDRKVRSPNLYERYTWSTRRMAMRMNGWFGDGNGYVGDIDLKPEKAHTASFTAAWRDPARQAWEVKVTPYYTYVEDYIDVDRCFTSAASTTCGNANLTATDNFVFLRFANHDAWLYGVNLSGKLALWNDPVYGAGAVRGLVGYVRGQRTDGVNLYHLMPINAKIAFDHALGGWTSSAEVQLVGSKDEVSQVRNELTTPAYALVNLRTGYQWRSFRFDVGIDNLFNKHYFLPLGGADIADHKVPGGAVYGFNVPGPGRSFNTRLTVAF